MDPELQESKDVSAEARGCGMSLSSQVNMINCYQRREHFFRRCNSIHFNVLIAYWMMAGYLGHVDSIKKAYKMGHGIFMDLILKEKMLQSRDPENKKIEIATLTDSEKPLPCRHKGLCFTDSPAFIDFLDLSTIGNAFCTDGMLKTVPDDNTDPSMGSLLIIDGHHLSRQVFRFLERIQLLTYFNPVPGSLQPLLQNVKQDLSVLLLRGCQLLRECDFPFQELNSQLKTLTVLEISGSSHLTTIPADTISQLTQLQCLNLSDLLIETLPENFFSNLAELRWVILRGCSRLRSLPTIRTLEKLEVLDVSHCTALIALRPDLTRTRNFTHLLLRNANVTVLEFLSQVHSLKVLDLSGALNVTQAEQLCGNRDLEVLDLSRTGIYSLDFLPILYRLRQLILQDCTSLVDLGHIYPLEHLEVLDISGCRSVRCFPEYLSEPNKLKELILSRTSIESIDFHSRTIYLRVLIVQECSSLVKLPAVEKLTNLEVLDISGCINLTDLPDDLGDLKSLKELNISGCTRLKILKESLFCQMSFLLKLDLSNTKFNRLPSFANLTSLCKLSLRGLELDSLESLASLSTLVELDLYSLKISSTPEFTFDFVQSSEKLQILNLSHTSVAKLPALSKLVSLKELLLANCRHLKSLPGLENLVNLEILDLSLKCKVQTEMEGQTCFYFPVPNCLRKLVLTNRSGLQQLFPMTSLSQLEYVDLRGTDMTNIPCELFAQVKCIRLPTTIDLSGVCLSRTGNLPEAIDWNGNHQICLQGHISERHELQIASAVGNKSCLSAGANQYFHLKEGNQGSWEAFIHQFSVSFPLKLRKDNVVYLDGDEFILRDEASWARKFLKLELKGRSVEIHGFYELPEDIRNVLQLADNVAFVGNNFLSNISDLCFEAMKVCCIRRCPKMKSVLTVVQEIGQVTRCPERLVLSNLVDLESIFAENVSPESIESLKHIHIDCCPKLQKVTVPSQVPKNLETLHIKFCDKLETLFEQNISGISLHTLSLFELPKLKEIEADLPQLESLSIGQCPRLKNLDRVIKSASNTLTQLSLDSCHSLVHALPSSVLLEKLQVLRISSCSGLVTLFDITGSSSSSLPKLHNLQTLKLQNLPKLISIGGALFSVLCLDLDPALPPSIIQQLSFPGQQH